MSSREKGRAERGTGGAGQDLLGQTERKRCRNPGEVSGADRHGTGMTSRMCFAHSELGAQRRQGYRRVYMRAPRHTQRGAVVLSEQPVAHQRREWHARGGRRWCDCLVHRIIAHQRRCRECCYSRRMGYFSSNFLLNCSRIRSKDQHSTGMARTPTPGNLA